jgi:hypothetical protein
VYDVSAMPINLKYVLVCDEVRQEINSKFIVIGLYTPDLSVPQIPFVTPSLTFFVCLESDRVIGTRHFTVRIEQLETGRAIVEGMGALQFNAPGLAVAPVRFGNLQFNAAGQYMFVMTIDGEAQPITAPFGVILNIPAQQAPH